MNALPTQHGPLATRRSVLLGASAAATVTAVPAFAAAPGRLPTLPIKAEAALAAGAPITFGHAYEKGAVKRGQAVTFTTPGGQPIVVQLDQVNRWSDGSLRFAAHSLRLPVAMSAGQVIHSQLGTTAAAAPGDGAITSAQLAAASDWKVKAHGFSYGTDTFTVAVNDILANFRDGRAGDKDFGGNNPLGGWELIRGGPYCTAWKAWRYLKRDSDGASHPWVKIEVYLASYPDGTGGLSYEVLPVVKQANAYGPHPAATVAISDAAKQRLRGGIYELWDGSRLVHTWGGATDPNAITITSGNLNPTTGDFGNAPLNLRVLKGAAYCLIGANLPHPCTTPAFASESGGYGRLYFSRQYAFENRGVSDPAWRPGEALAQYQGRKANGCIWLNLTAGTTAAGSEPHPTNPQGGFATGSDGIQWLQINLAFSARQPASFKLAPVICTTAGSASALVPPSAAPVWQGMAGRDKLVIGLDPDYLMKRTRAVTPIDPGAPVPNYDASFAPPYRPNHQYLFTGRLTWNATGDAADDECIGWLGVSPTNLALNPLDPVCERAVRSLSYGMSDFQINWDDTRTGRPVHGGTKPWPGFIPNPGVDFYPSQPGHGSPGWAGIEDYDNWYQGGYGQMVDSSHMPSPFIMPYLRSAHPFFIDQALSQSLAVNNSLSSANRNPTDSLGVRRDYNFLYLWNGGNQPRIYAWALRHHGTLDFLMPDDDPARPMIRDMMDGIGSYAGIFVSECDRGAIPGVTSMTGWTNLGLLYCSDGTDVTDPINHNPSVQGVHCFMYAHLGTALFMEQWRSDRSGFTNMADALARYVVGAFDSQNGGSTYYVHTYAIGSQDAKGQPAYPNWRTLWAKNNMNPNGPGKPAPATGFNQGFGANDTGGMFLGAIAMRATAAQDRTALRVLNDAVARTKVPPYAGNAYIFPSGIGFYAGHPFCSAPFAITPVMGS